MIYKVTINYTSFTFEDGLSAINFAALAKDSCAEDRVSVDIEVLKEEEVK